MSLETKKRKLLTDFFTPTAKVAKPSPASPCPPCKQAVPGLSLYPNFVSGAEESQIIQFLNSDQCTWRTDLSRKTMHFGGEYCLMPPRVPPGATGPRRDNRAGESHSSPPNPQPETIQAPPMPPEFSWLIHRMHARGIYSPAQTPQYCIVNHYTSSQGISAHTENFSFAEPIVGLSLLGACSMRFHELLAPDGGSVRSGKAQRAKRTGRRVDVWLPARSLLVMREEARWRWQHEIVRSVKGRGEGWERVSLTFRVKGSVR